MTEKIQHTYQIVMLSGRVVGIVSPMDYQALTTALLANGYIMTANTFMPYHAMEAVVAGPLPEGIAVEEQSFPSPVGSA